MTEKFRALRHKLANKAQVVSARNAQFAMIRTEDIFVILEALDALEVASQKPETRA